MILEAGDVKDLYDIDCLRENQIVKTLPSKFYVRTRPDNAIYCLQTVSIAAATIVTKVPHIPNLTSLVLVSCGNYISVWMPFEREPEIGVTMQGRHCVTRP